MTSPNQIKTLSPSQRCALTELRVSAKRGLVHFSQTINQFDTETLAEIINETFLCYENQEMTLLIQATMSRHVQIVEFLLENCLVNVNATGRVSHLTSIVEGATALWCAAASGYLDIVKMLINKGATVDHCTTSKSTPLRAACYLGDEAIVQYLIQNGADVNKTNVFNSTCLMLASYKGHNNIVKYLLKNGADVNVQTNCGATAMHFAAQANHITVIKLLLEFNAKQTKNDHSLTPILVAAERTHYELVKYLLDTLNLTRKELIEVEELLGASFLNDKDSYDIHLGFALLKHSMEMRFDGDPVIPKDVYKKVEAYNNQVECQNVEDLMKIRQDHSALHYESLIIRERILGTKNADLLRSIIYRGAVYADSKQFLPCLKLWFHAMKISRTNNFSIYKDLLRFTQVFCQMIKANKNIVLTDLINVMQAAVEEFKMHHKRLKTDLSAEHRESIEVQHLSNVFSTLGLIIIASNALEHTDNSTDPLKGDLMKTIVELNKLDIRTEFGQTLLHLCLDYDTNIDNIFTTGICSFPNYHTMKLLIYCGADVNAVDLDNNTPLHNIGKFIVDFPHIPHNSDYLESKKMVIELLNAGAHTDFVNKYGLCPHTSFLKRVFNLTNHTPRSLKCLSCIALKNNFPKEFYSNQLPKTLDLFTSLH